MNPSQQPSTSMGRNLGIDMMKKLRVGGPCPLKSDTGGNHPILMDDPAATNATRVGARQAMGQARRLASRVNLAAMSPTDNPAVCSTRYCLRNPGRDHILYQPRGGPFTVQLPAGSYRVEWLDATDGRVQSLGTIRAESGPREFTPPWDGSSVLFLSSRP